MSGPNVQWSENIGPVEVFFDNGGGDVSLGETKGGVTATANESSAPTTTDKTGTTKRQEIITGIDAMVSGALTEVSLEQLAALFNTSVTGASTTELAIFSRVGADLRGTAGILTLKPIIAGITDVDASNWFYYPAANSKAQFEVSLDLENQRVWNFEFNCYPVTADELISGNRLAGLGYTVNQIMRFGLAS